MRIRKSNHTADAFFSTKHLQGNLKQRAVRGGATTITAQGLKFTLTLVANVVLGRFLTPNDYGLVGMVTAVMGFVTIFKDLGLSMATVQKEDINHEQVSTLFWINVSFSLGVAILAACLSPLIAGFYNEPRLTLITIALAGGIVMGGLGVQHTALLQRQMSYNALAFNDVFAQLSGVSAAFLCVWLGWGYWSLIALSLVTISVNTLGIWIACRWVPGLPRWNTEMRSLMVFGSNITGFSIVNYLSLNLDNVLIGKFWGSQQLGLYAKAYQLLLLPISQINAPITNVAVPVLSRLVDSPSRYRQVYLRILEKLMLLTLPIILFMIAASDWLIQMLLGSQWLGASAIFALLGISGLMRPIANSVGWLFITQDRTDDLFRWGLLSSTITIFSFGVGLPWQALGVAISYSSIALCITMPLLFFVVGRHGPVKTKDFYVTMAPLGFSTLCTILALGTLRYLIQPQPFWGCCLAFVVTIMSFFTALVALPKGRNILWDLKQLMSDLKTA